MKRRTNRKSYRRSRTKRGGGVGGPSSSLSAAYPGSTIVRNVRTGATNISYPLGDDGLKLHINHFRAESDINIRKLSIFFTVYCWKDTTNPDEEAFKHLEMLRGGKGHFIYITDASNHIIFAQLALIDDKPSGERHINLMGTCTAPKHRGKGLFKRSLPLITEHYKRLALPRKDIKSIALTANYKDRNGVTAQGRHIVFSKSGMTLANYINSTTQYYVKTDDGKIYKVLPKASYADLKPNSPLEAIVEEADGSHKKIPVANITGCYKDAEATAREECPFILPLVYDH